MSAAFPSVRSLDLSQLHRGKKKNLGISISGEESFNFPPHNCHIRLHYTEQVDRQRARSNESKADFVVVVLFILGKFFHLKFENSIGPAAGGMLQQKNIFFLCGHLTKTDFFFKAVHGFSIFLIFLQGRASLLRRNDGSKRKKKVKTAAPPGGATLANYLQNS